MNDHEALRQLFGPAPSRLQATLELHLRAAALQQIEKALEASP